MNTPTIGVAPAATYAARTAEVPDSNFYSGGEGPSLNAPGIGIAVGGGSVAPERLEAWTEEDQFGNNRTPQNSQPIGGVGLTTTADWPLSGGEEGFTNATPVEAVTPSNEGDGKFTVDGAATLGTITAGWTAA